MNNKMKTIDLLNKIANGEEVPKKIAIQNDVLIYNEENKILFLQDYYYMNDVKDETWKIWAYSLNDEVEILDNEDEDIEELPIWCSSYPKGEDITTEQDHMITNSKKINELVRAVNKLKKEGK